MKDQNRNKLNVDGGQYSKYRKYTEEVKEVSSYLSNRSATATMVAVALDIYRPNLCRIKRSLEENGTLIVSHKDACKVTGFKACYLTCDPQVIIERSMNA